MHLVEQFSVVLRKFEEIELLLPIELEDIPPVHIFLNKGHGHYPLPIAF